MIKRLLLVTAIYVALLTALTAFSPGLGFRLAELTGTVMAQPIVAGLKLGILIRGQL